MREFMLELLGTVGPTTEEIAASIRDAAPSAGLCVRSPAGVDSLVTSGVYRDPLATLIRHGKYDADDRPFRALGRWLGVEFQASCMIPSRSSRSHWRVLAVPQHPVRRFHRGIDHSFELARAFARETRIPMVRWLRRRWGPTQVGRDGASRRLKRTDIRVRKGIARTLERNLSRSGGVPGVVLVDDVVTTGSTMAACAGILREIGVSAIHGAAASVSEDWCDGFIHRSSTRPLQGWLGNEIAGIA